MTAQSIETELTRHSLELGNWENEGGAPSWDSMDHHYGRRIESDRSWSIYHVYTGHPAAISGHSMTGLSKLEAGKGVMKLNLRNERRRNERQDALREDARNQNGKDGS